VPRSRAKRARTSNLESKRRKHEKKGAHYATPCLAATIGERPRDTRVRAIIVGEKRGFGNLRVLIVVVVGCDSETSNVCILEFNCGLHILSISGSRSLGQILRTKENLIAPEGMGGDGQLILSKGAGSLYLFSTHLSIHSLHIFSSNNTGWLKNRTKNLKSSFFKCCFRETAINNPRFYPQSCTITASGRPPVRLDDSQNKDFVISKPTPQI
jgi:hypothetical protein